MRFGIYFSWLDNYKKKKKTKVVPIIYKLIFGILSGAIGIMWASPCNDSLFRMIKDK